MFCFEREQEKHPKLLLSSESLNQKFKLLQIKELPL